MQIFSKIFILPLTILLLALKQQLSLTNLLIQKTTQEFLSNRTQSKPTKLKNTNTILTQLTPNKTSSYSNTLTKDLPKPYTKTNKPKPNPIFD